MASRCSIHTASYWSWTPPEPGTIDKTYRPVWHQAFSWSFEVLLPPSKRAAGVFCWLWMEYWGWKQGLTAECKGHAAICREGASPGTQICPLTAPYPKPDPHQQICDLVTPDWRTASMTFLSYSSSSFLGCGHVRNNCRHKYSFWSYL